MTGWGLFLGLTTGLGLVLIASWHKARTPSLSARVIRLGPTREGMAGSAVVPVGGVLGGIAMVIVRDAVRFLDRWGSPTADLESRLRRAGSSLSVSQYRAEQVVWGLIGAGAGVGLAGAAASRGGTLIPVVAMIVCSGMAGVVLRDRILSRAIRRREERIASELPTMADMLALSVSAGEGAAAAVERITRMGSGVLAEEFAVVLGQARTGTPLAFAFHDLAGRTGVPALARFATGVAIAVERGTPLADVLHAQALDVREAGRRRLIEEGGKREIAMMVPVVFLLLPVTVVFAVFPGIVAIRLGP